MLRSACVFALSLLACAACDKTSKVGPDAPNASTVKAMTPTATPGTAESQKLAKSSNELGFDLYGKVRSTPGNLAMSPASISAALAMTWGGARAETEAQMKKVMHLDGSRDAVMADWGGLSRSLQDPGRPLKLRIANRLFGEKTYTFDQAYLDKTKAAYGAVLEPNDFKTGFEPARVHINGWVEEQTEKRIKDLLPAGALTGDTRLVLVNAIYFLADWATPFEKHATYDDAFHTGASGDKRTPMMHATFGFRMAEADGVKVLELPYKGGDAAMVFVLPNKVDGLADVEASLSAAKLEAWTSALKSQRVMVTLPRFEVSPPSMELRAKLIELGMTDAFDRDKADFTGIANPRDARDRLMIDKVFHKAFVKVDEKGTEAAAATAVVMARAGSAAPAPSPEFRADHPFLFFIVDKATGLVLFVGRVVDPTAR